MDTMLREIICLTQKLIRFPSTASQPAQRKACADFIAAWLADCGLDPARTEHEGVACISAMPEPGRCRVLLMAHFDVVDAPERLFEPVEESGRLHGRGAIDDKYAVATAMVLMKHQHLRGGPAPLGILLTGDEEVGGRRGARRALEGVSAEFAIALDGGDPQSLVVLQKGVLRLVLTARGKAAHGARPWLGVNAVEALMADLAALKSLFAHEREDHWNRTLNIGMVAGGTAVNMVPAEARAWLDVRYTEDDDPEALLAEIRSAVQGEVALERQDIMFQSGDSPLFERLLRRAKGARPAKAHGASDARFLSERGIPGVVWGAQGGGSQHSDDEYLDIASLAHVVAVLWDFLDDARTD
ncbi:M20 family metallopeptidase [Fundidesulfovibrio terrae]|uniref:M20 family metallopeptidase n=1 Tax=Fundidesulfovibrio terrae TaxID=2922866 RepID=UPI001FAF58D2|nr:M20/M25/M40 family metallo-hydrolase [Fundidesulfovibrio terrae]